MPAAEKLRQAAETGGNESIAINLNLLDSR